MLEIIEGSAVLAHEAVDKIVEFERLLKEVKQKEDELKARILAEMEAYGVFSIESPEIKISYVAPTNREVFDSKAFRKDFEDLYDEYVVVTPVKASLRIKVK